MSDVRLLTVKILLFLPEVQIGFVDHRSCARPTHLRIVSSTCGRVIRRSSS
jgi:hypothetical protein